MKKLVLVFILLLQFSTVSLAQGEADFRNLLEQRAKLVTQQSLGEIEAVLKKYPALANEEFKQLYGNGQICPLSQALTLGDVGLASVLLSNGADPNHASGRRGMRPLAWAMNDLVDPLKITKSVALLLSQGADPNLTDKNQGSALHRWAARRAWHKTDSYTQVGTMLLEAKVQVEGDPEAPGSPLMIAVLNNNPTAVAFLLKAGADPDAKSLLGTAREQAKKEAARASARPEAQVVLQHFSVRDETR